MQVMTSASDLSSAVPSVYACRQAVASDIKDIEVLENALTKAVFGEVSLADLIEKATSKSLINEEKQLVAFISVLDHPNKPLLSHQCSWQNWVRQYYRLKSTTPWNSLFIQYLVWDIRYPDFFVNFLKYFYKNCVHLENILMVTPPGFAIFSEISMHFIPIYPQDVGEHISLDTSTQTLYLNLRVNVVRKLIIRHAGEEDNIDVQPILLYQYDVLRHVFGDFKVGEVIDLQDKNKSILVAEVSAYFREEDNIDVQPILLYQYDVLRHVFGDFKVGEVIDLQDKNKSILVAEVSAYFREEDNIDVQPILLYQYDVLRHVFGDFKVGEVIDLQDKNKSILVAEQSSEVTVGVMVVTTDIDYNHVNEYFYLPTGDCSDHSWISRSQMSKLTLKGESLVSSLDYDFFLLRPEVFDDEYEESSSSSEEIYTPFKNTEDVSSIYLYDDEREFRIVDPAMEYLMNKQTRPRSLYSSSEAAISRGSTASSSMNAYYGRPSWSLQVQATSTNTVCKDRAMAVPGEQPSYSGPAHGITISLFALHPDLDERYAFDLLEAAFECYPEKTYCLLSLPTSYQGSPLSRHFVRLTPRLCRDFPHELYMAHRNSVFSDFSVRPFSLVDYEPIAEMIENASHGSKVMKSIINCRVDSSTTNQGYVLECEGCIVGVAVVGKNFGLQLTQPHYRLEDVIPLHHYGWDRHGVLRHVIVSVEFLQTASFFLRQIMHQSGLETLSYCLLPADLMSRADISMATVLGDMDPVRPRRRIQHDLDALDIYRPEEPVTRMDHDYALFVTTERLLGVPKLELNYRLVVVGSSDTALSFLEHLIFEHFKNNFKWCLVTPKHVLNIPTLLSCLDEIASSAYHIRYNNLTMISIHGMPLELGPHKAGETMVPHCGLYTRDYLARLGLQTHVNIMYGALTVINRQEKMICLNDQHWLRYDYLFLFTGVQFCQPMISNEHLDRDACQKTVDIREIYTRESKEMGDNLFVVNTTTDAILALSALKKIVMSSNKLGKIIVHGGCLNIYSCTQSLLMFGVPGHKIAIVETSDTCRMCGLDINTSIEKAVVHSLHKLGVIVYHGYHLVNWKLRHKSIYKVLFHTDTNSPLIVDCLAMFYYGPKNTSAKTYSALVGSGIVYNDGIIINSRFRTNDQFIYAAGPGTKYSGRYQDSQGNHWYCSSREASKMFRKVVEPKRRDPEDIEDQLPIMSDPVVLVAKLPGDWNYFRVSAPGRPLPLECQLHGQGESGPVLVTGDPAEPDGPGYFQLSLSVYGTVREIACLSKKDIPHYNLECLYGKHERLLNNLLEHYNLGLINDLFAFFSQPWAYALYTTRFNQLERECAELYQNNEDAGLAGLRDLEHTFRERQQRLSLEVEETISQMYAHSSVPLYVENLTLKYVSEHKLQLPMYLRDDHVTTIQRSYASSPLHKEARAGRNYQNTSFD